jgi:hypothetical protein
MNKGIPSKEDLCTAAKVLRWGAGMAEELHKDATIWERLTRDSIAPAMRVAASNFEEMAREEGTA